MFIFTAKLNRKKALAVVLALAALLCALILLVGRRDQSHAAEAFVQSDTLSDNGDRVALLESLGWLVAEEPLEEQSVLIPRQFTGAYADYLALQTAQGFELAKYSGLEATRYTYEVLSYPTGETGVVADLIVYRGTLIAGDVQSTRLDGFMHGLVGDGF